MRARRRTGACTGCGTARSTAGAALFKQDRVIESIEQFEEACDLLDASGTADEKMIRAYRNSKIYSSTRFRDERK